ncbi:unnamed protein product [Periconia digitata]|uniref:Zn(2)-C6 fungal-type domain-containing protein n=1 Tax=Periconia digitata TaxID=1303443 RepID=A0A9W4UGA3_9PLEO|nr:unnamed protein product [Periconia digitata]
MPPKPVPPSYISPKSTAVRRRRPGQASWACLACQKRKSRCATESAVSHRCQMCRFRDTECIFPASDKQNGAPSGIRRVRTPRDRHLQPTSSVVHGSGGQPSMCNSRGAEILTPGDTPFPGPSRNIAEDEDEMHVVGPVNDTDTRLIADYISNSSATGFLLGGSNFTKTTPIYSMGNHDPVVFNTVRRRPLGAMVKESPASMKLHIIEQVLGAFCGDLLEIYFQKVHVCFPLLDEVSFKSQYATSKIYARNSASLPAHWAPDIMFIWNQANEALYSELHVAPSISVLIAILLNISGRPLTSVIGNGILLGSAVAIAHGLGLNRNCLDWEISVSEKRLRTRLWWALFIYDKWSSVAYGTPPHLKRTEHNVSTPSADLLHEGTNAADNPTATSIFVQSITLTQVLDSYLEHIFHLQQDVFTNRPKIENKLANWEYSLPPELRRIVLRGVNLQDPGSSNLRLAYLYVRLLDRRLEADRLSHQTTALEALDPNRMLEARRVAQDIVSLVQELDGAALTDFWLPLCAFVLSSTVAFLLRCALEIEHHDVGLAQSISLKLASSMIEALRIHKQEYGWDIGDICLAQYADVTDKLTAAEIHIDEALQQFLFTEFSGATDMHDAHLNLWDFA